ncbi:MAG TPA: hypothetical protein VF263_03125 [Longimicrobiaceae bacterium]
MSRRILLAAAAALALAGGTAAPAAAQSCSAPSFVEQGFPTTAAQKKTAWRLCWAAEPGWGVYVRAAEFRRSPTSPWVRVFYDARVSEIFVPYHAGSPRYYDFEDYGFDLATLNTNDCPASAGGTLLGAAKQVCKQVRGRGLSWRSSSGVYRGEELVLWGAVAAANYYYIIEWTFRDDGVVMGRFGATGTNLPSSPTMAHMHNAMWRLDIDLNGAANDNVQREVHTENLPGATATDTHPAVTQESSLAWDDLRFGAVSIGDTGLKNGRGSFTRYHLMPERTGTARHQEPWTGADFWVTRYNPTEMRPTGLPGYINPPGSVSNTDVVLWYWGSVHHHFRDEDGVFSNNGNAFSGVAQVMWTTFILKPMNLFDAPPFWP